MNFPVFALLVMNVFFHQGIGQTCLPTSLAFEKMVVKSPIVVEAMLAQTKLRKLQNITAILTKTYSTHNGGLKTKSEITFGPIGKSCMKVKRGKTYVLFLTENGLNNFFLISYYPVRKSKKISRSLRKLLCKNCLVPASFKKRSKSIDKVVGDKLKIKCKPTGKPAASISWFYNGELLTKSNTPNDITIKTRRKGGSSTLQIRKLQMKHSNNVFVCSASNAVSESPAKFTVTVEVAEPCQSACPMIHANLCLNGGCCQMVNASPHCKCTGRWTGDRCSDISHSSNDFLR